MDIKPTYNTSYDETQIAGNATEHLQFVCLGEILSFYLNM